MIKILLRGAFACAVAVLCSCGGEAGGGSGTSTPPTTTTTGSGTTNSATSAYGVLGTPTVRVAFVPSPGGVTPFLLENTGMLTVTWGNALDGSGIVPTVPFTFPISACTVDSSSLKAVCIGYASSRVAVMNLSTFTQSLRVVDITVQEFDSGAGSTAIGFSGASCILCGVSADVGKQRYVVSGAGGFRLFSYGSTTATAIYDIQVGENFALLPQATGSSYVVAPEYEPSGGNRKLRVVNLDSGLAHVWTRNTDSLTDLGAAGFGFVISEVDAASVDLNTKMIVLSVEDSGDFMLIDFGQASFDDAARTFSAPFTFAKPNAATPVKRLTDLAVSTAGSILLSHGEADSNIGVTRLPNTSGTGGVGTGPLGVLDLNDPNLDHAPCGTTYNFIGKGDPHGLSLYAGIDNGQRGLVIDVDNVCAAIVDLVGLVGAARSATDPNLIDTSVPGVRAMVRFVKLR